MTDIDLNDLAVGVHEANRKWWVSLETGEPIERNKYELLMLMQSEVAEAMEGERKGLRDDKLPTRPMAEVEMADVVIRALDYAGGFSLRLDDARGALLNADPGTDLHPWSHFTPATNRGEMLFSINRLIDEVPAPWRYPGQGISEVIAGCRIYCDLAGYDLWGAFEEKMSFNAVRADHQVEARRAAGGKKW